MEAFVGVEDEGDGRACGGGVWGGALGLHDLNNNELVYSQRRYIKYGFRCLGVVR